VNNMVNRHPKAQRRGLVSLVAKIRLMDGLVKVG